MASISQTVSRRWKETSRVAARRFWEVDTLRGVAIAMMVIFHLMWDLRAFAEYYVVLHEGFWFYFQQTIATLFISLAGVSLVLSYNRAKERQGNTRGLYAKFLKRGLRIFGVGMILTVVFAVLRLGADEFGVLHLIGFSIIIVYPFLRYRYLNLGLGVGLIALGFYFRTFYVDYRWLVWLGLEPRNYYYSDYFPVVPWFGVVLLGIFVGNMLYRDGRRQLALPDLSRFIPLTWLQFLGRHSLLIYVIHQPILMVVLTLTGVIHLL
jgi:uncharacterized membrane protein